MRVPGQLARRSAQPSVEEPARRVSISQGTVERLGVWLLFVFPYALVFPCLTRHPFDYTHAHARCGTLKNRQFPKWSSHVKPRGEPESSARHAVSSSVPAPETWVLPTAASGLGHCPRVVRTWGRGDHAICMGPRLGPADVGPPHGCCVGCMCCGGAGATRCTGPLNERPLSNPWEWLAAGCASVELTVWQRGQRTCLDR